MERFATHFEQVPKIVIDRILAQQDSQAKSSFEDVDCPAESATEQAKRPVAKQAK